MGLQWDLFCRVVDNFGDIGVCWRLAADLASRGESVRLWVDHASALRWMAPAGAERVTVSPWREEWPAVAPGDVVIEAFGCNPPAPFVAAMAARAVPPVWINLEYLSAEAYVERNHRLPSLHASGLKKWFFYPGFTPRTGGLLREADLLTRHQAFDRKAWLQAVGVGRHEGEQIVSLFCYDNPALPALLEQLAQRPTLLLTTPGPATQQVAALLGPTLQCGALRVVALPALTQRDYDHLLWSCDLNFVRGEDSFVRAQWAGRPFVWQIYPQDDAAHATKLGAFLQLHLAGAEESLAADIRTLWARWNGLSAAPLRLPDDRAWHRHTLAWREQLRAQADLVSQLISFAGETR
jgi:uncharacterized repeat protein (TIGR03837 family)